MYYGRTLSEEIQKASQHFKVLLLTGPRQVGKTTLLKHLSRGDGRHYITFDDLDTRAAATEDPKTFISQLKTPVLIDEVQYVPELFSYIKMKVDSEQKNGQFWLTGSQHFAMMKNISDSLAGRVAIFELLGLSLREQSGDIVSPPFIPIVEELKKREIPPHKTLSPSDLYDHIWRGSFPDLVKSEAVQWERFYSSYITSYTEKDVRDYLNIDNLVLFRKFLQVCASRTAQMLSYTDMSRSIGVAVQTIKSWVNVLIATGHIILLQPYYNNFTKRALKTPKLHFLDTGLCSYLTGWLSADVLQRGAMSGQILESFVVSEIYKSYIHNGKKPPMYYYTDKEKNEVDVLIEQNQELFPIEVKQNTNIRSLNKHMFQFLDKVNVKIGSGAVLSPTDTSIPVSDRVQSYPISWV